MGEVRGPRRDIGWDVRTVAVIAAGGLLSAAAVAASIRWRPAAAGPLLFGLVVIAGAAVVISARSKRPSRTTTLVGFAGVTAVVLAMLLGALGIEAPAKDVVGVVGAVAALVTLVLVQRQIDVAHEQVDLARHEIKLVANDLEYSREQSEFTRAQLAELARRPQLTVSFADGENIRILPRIRGHSMFSADLLLRNDGDRTARDAYIETLIPWSLLEHHYSDQQIAQRADTEVVDGVAHRLFGKQVVEPIYRGLSRLVGVFSEQLILSPKSFTLRWRLRDDYGAYPADAQWGRLEVRVPLERETPRLRYTRRWDVEPYPMLGWDRSGPDRFIYANLVPDAADQVALIDERLKRRIEDIVWSMPGLEGTTPQVGEIGVEFTGGDPREPVSAADNDDINAAAVYERARHRCYARVDGAVEVRLPQDDGHPVYQVLRVLGATYGIATGLHHELGTAPRARGRLAYHLGALPGGAPIGLENDQWIEMRLGRDEFVETVTSIMMRLQLAGRIAPVESETRSMVDRFWRPYAVRLASFAADRASGTGGETP